ncbi:MAG: type II toxin-antitoxin system Phd/YefM family antitoxin [Candidatus Rokubacteria bacterium]|nr:type II toxin-antitoxin system Phd/YefM family antitoxin [Candidatus Rokubacteria bacterium]MBI2553160.1 type II toxin-antitoxin system Phd/YefM family antitoxin [Candidatus Rokubacteria bacterium]
MVEKVAVSEARRNIADLIGRVHYRGARIVLERSGKPVAVLISMEDYAALAEMLEDLEDLRDARKMLGELKREELVDFRDYVKTRKRKAV